MQPVVMRMIKNAIWKDRLAHAYLFEGMRGTGKKETALLLAKSLFCEDPAEGYIPCESCRFCRRINHGNHPDVHVIEPEGASIKKHQIKMLQEEFAKTAMESNRKVYIINHADLMTVNAANSLLKFLEEPDSHTTAILITEQVQQILPTILSRCQVVSFKPLPFEKLVEMLIDAGVNPKKAPLIAKMTNSFDEGMALNEDEWFAQAQKLVVKLYETLKKSPLEALTALQDNWFAHFSERDQHDKGLELLLLLLRDLLYIQLGKKEQVVFLLEEQRLEQLALQSSGLRLANQMASVMEAKRKLHANMNPQLLMEQLVLELQEG